MSTIELWLAILLIVIAFVVGALISVGFSVLYYRKGLSAKQKKLEEARNSLQRGDKVVTIGGIHGKITDIKDNTFTIEIAHDVRIEVDKAAISFNEAALNQSKQEPKQEPKPEEKKENE